MLLQTNSYIVPKEKRAEHARLVRRFRQTLGRLGCEQFEVYEQVGPNWSTGDATGRFVQIMRFRDRRHQLAVQAAERNDADAQHLIAEFCDLINFPYQQQQGLFAIGFYNSALPVAPPRVQVPSSESDAEADGAEEFAGAAAAAPFTGFVGGGEPAVAEEAELEEVDAAVVDEAEAEAALDEFEPLAEEEPQAVRQPTAHAPHAESLEDDLEALTSDDAFAAEEAPATAEHARGEAGATGEPALEEEPVDEHASAASAFDGDVTVAEAEAETQHQTAAEPAELEDAAAGLLADHAAVEAENVEAEAGDAEAVWEPEPAGVDELEFEEIDDASVAESAPLVAESTPTVADTEAHAPQAEAAPVAAEAPETAAVDTEKQEDDFGLEELDFSVDTEPATASEAVAPPAEAQVSEEAAQVGPGALPLAAGADDAGVEEDFLPALADDGTFDAEIEAALADIDRAEAAPVAQADGVHSEPMTPPEVGAQAPAADLNADTGLVDEDWALLDEELAPEPVAHGEASAVTGEAADAAAQEPIAHEPIPHEPAAHEPAAQEPAAHEPAAHEPGPSLQQDRAPETQAADVHAHTETAEESLLEEVLLASEQAQVADALDDEPLDEEGGILPIDADAPITPDAIVAEAAADANDVPLPAFEPIDEDASGAVDVDEPATPEAAHRGLLDLEEDPTAAPAASPVPTLPPTPSEAAAGSKSPAGDELDLDLEWVDQSFNDPDAPLVDEAEEDGEEPGSTLSDDEIDAALNEALKELDEVDSVHHS